MFRIKICGITQTEDAKAAVAAGADAIGLNFYSNSSRYVSAAAAKEIRTAASRSTLAVGVFVNADPETIHETVETVGIDVIQLHGDEPPKFLASISDELSIIRVYRLGDAGYAPITADLAACQRAGRMPDTVLIDAAAPGQYGGSGETAPWHKLAGFRAWLGKIPLILAGGLTPENVAEAVLTVQPDGVDVASGVEAAAGIKDKSRVKAFIKAANGLLSS